MLSITLSLINSCFLNMSKLFTAKANIGTDLNSSNQVKLWVFTQSANDEGKWANPDFCQYFDQGYHFDMAQFFHCAKKLS